MDSPKPARGSPIRTGGCSARVLAERSHEALGDLEHPTIFGDVLAHQDEMRIPLHGLAQPFRHRVHEPPLSRRAVTGGTNSPDQRA